MTQGSVSLIEGERLCIPVKGGDRVEIPSGCYAWLREGEILRVHPGAPFGGPRILVFNMRQRVFHAFVGPDAAFRATRHAIRTVTRSKRKLDVESTEADRLDSILAHLYARSELLLAQIRDQQARETYTYRGIHQLLAGHRDMFVGDRDREGFEKLQVQSAIALRKGLRSGYDYPWHLLGVHNQRLLDAYICAAEQDFASAEVYLHRLHEMHFLLALERELQRFLYASIIVADRRGNKRQELVVRMRLALETVDRGLRGDALPGVLDVEPHRIEGIVSLLEMALRQNLNQARSRAEARQLIKAAAELLVGLLR